MVQRGWCRGLGLVSSPAAVAPASLPWAWVCLPDTNPGINVRKNTRLRILRDRARAEQIKYQQHAPQPDASATARPPYRAAVDESAPFSPALRAASSLRRGLHAPTCPICHAKPPRRRSPPAEQSPWEGPGLPSVTPPLLEDSSSVLLR